MNGYWNSLRPMEKRLVVGVGTMVVILLNLWFVVPHFSDLPKVRDRKNKAEYVKTKFEEEIARKPIYVQGITNLQGGQDVPAEDWIYDFQNKIQSEAVSSGVQIRNQPKPRSETNTFFIQQVQSLQLDAKEQQLVNFLYGLGNGPSIRVRGLNLHADPSHTLLQAGVTLVASYQKKTPVRGTAPAAQKSTTSKAPVPAQHPPPSSPRTVKPGTTNAPANPPTLPGGKSIPSNNKKT